MTTRLLSTFVSLLGLAAAIASWAGADELTARSFRLGIVSPGIPRSAAPYAAVEDRLRALGYTDGKNLAIDFLSLDANTERYPAAMTELVGRGVNVILGRGDALMTATSPIFFILEKAVHHGGTEITEVFPRGRISPTPPGR
jgi:hypothetical protein